MLLITEEKNKEFVMLEMDSIDVLLAEINTTLKVSYREENVTNMAGIILTIIHPETSKPKHIFFSNKDEMHSFLAGIILQREISKNSTVEQKQPVVSGFEVWRSNSFSFETGFYKSEEKTNQPTVRVIEENKFDILTEKIEHLEKIIITADLEKDFICNVIDSLHEQAHKQDALLVKQNKRIAILLETVECQERRLKALTKKINKIKKATTIK